MSFRFLLTSSLDDSLVIDSSAGVATLGLDKQLHTIADDYDSLLEVSETQFGESETGELSDGEFVDVRVRALPFRRATNSGLYHRSQ